MSRLYANNISTTLSSGLAAGATSASITSATGFPTITGSDYYYLTIESGADIEIVKVTARTGTTLTIERAQEGTADTTFSSGATVEMRATAESLTPLVTGPSSATDNAVARFDATTGKLVQNSVVTVSDTGTIAGVESITVGTTTVATDDKVLVNDTSASDTTKTVTTQSIANLAKAASTTDNAIARYDGTNGDFQNSVVIVADTTGNISGSEQISASKNIVVGGNSTAAGYIDLLEDSDNGSNKITLIAPASVASDKTITLPDTTGTVYVSGGTDVSLADGGTGASLTDPNADRIMFWDDSAGVVTWLEVGSGLSISDITLSTTGGGGGKILQVQTASKTDTFSTTSTSFTDITGLSVSITPTASTSTILVMASIAVANNTNDASVFVRAMRGATPILVGTSVSSRVACTGHMRLSLSSNHDKMVYFMAFSGVDSPATTSATTYKLQMQVDTTTTGYVNRTSDDADTNSRPRTSSSITVLEIGV